MRLGVDLHAIQAPSCRGRGIGRYAKSLLRALLQDENHWDFVFYYRADLELDWDDEPVGDLAEWIVVEPDPPGHADGTLQHLVQKNPHELDWLLILNPIVERRGFAIPESVPWGPKLAAVVYDFIPALFPRHYLDDEHVASEYYRDLRRLQTYDLVLAISEATREDTQKLLGIPERRIANIQAATDTELFRPSSDAAWDVEHDAQLLARHGIRKPFLYYLGNVDWRKNTIGLIDVFALLPADLRRRHQLVLTCQNNPWYLERLRERIAQYGLEESVVLTGPVSDEEIRAFYRRTEIFLFPSLYEGFGLPLLEAMHSGAAVVAADNSSQPEVVGPAGVLAKTGNARDWAEKVAKLLHSPARIAELRRAAIKQASLFTWEESARKLCEAIETAVVSQFPRHDPPLGIVPYPSPAELGFDPPSVELFARLCQSWKPVVFYDAENVAELPPCPFRADWHDKKLMGRIRPIVGNPPLLYLVDTLDGVGNLLDDLRRFPGVVAFCNDRIASWSDLVSERAGPLAPDARIEDELRQVVYHAKAVACHSVWLRDRLNNLAEGCQVTPIHHVTTRNGSGSPPGMAPAENDAETVYARLLRAS